MRRKWSSIRRRPSLQLSAAPAHYRREHDRQTCSRTDGRCNEKRALGERARARLPCESAAECEENPWTPGAARSGSDLPPSADLPSFVPSLEASKVGPTRTTADGGQPVGPRLIKAASADHPSTSLQLPSVRPTPVPLTVKSIPILVSGSPNTRRPCNSHTFLPRPDHPFRFTQRYTGDGPERAL